MNLLTKRIPTIVGLILLVAGIFGSYYYYQQNSTTNATELIPDKVRITNIADNKFSVSWISKVNTTGYIEYGQVGDKLTLKAYDERDTVNKKGQYLTHQVTVEGLQPATQYAFRILVGDKPARFDNSGSPYLTSTGPVIGATPPSQNFYGNVQQASKQVAEGALVYVTLPGSATASTLVTSSGNYAVTLSTMRTSDLRGYVKYDPSATIASVTVESGKLQSTSAVALTNSAPVPTITLGQNVDYLTSPETPAVAEVDTTSAPTESSNIPTTPTVFNVEPLTDTPDVNAVTSQVVTILNPKESGETLATLRPEFRGTGPKGTTLSIALTGQKAISDTVLVGNDGTWSWAPVIDLKTGKQTITVSYLDDSSVKQKIERDFNVSATKIGVDPAFVSSPSASTTAVATASGTPREAMPDTTNGTPVTGVIENTLLTGGLGIVIMIVGAALLSL